MGEARTDEEKDLVGCLTAALFARDSEYKSQFLGKCMLLILLASAGHADRSRRDSVGSI